MSLKLVPPAPPAPEHVVILGLGPSLAQYFDLVRGMGGRRALADEVWAINQLGDLFQCDRIFHQDDVRIQEVRAAAKPKSNIAVMLEWMRRHPGPIYTSRTHPDYPGLVEYPLEAVMNDLGHGYLNNTAAMAAAYAVHIGVKRLSLFGCDYTYANAHHAEKGRACLEFTLGIAKARGIDICVSEHTSLLDSCEAESLYGYGRMGSRDVHVEDGPDGFKVTFTERDALPTADEIEAEYCHSKHPSPLVSGKAA